MSRRRGVEQIEQFHVQFRLQHRRYSTRDRLTRYSQLESHRDDARRLAGETDVVALCRRVGATSRHLLECGRVGERVRIVQRPGSDETLHVLAKRTIGRSAASADVARGVRGELGQHAHQRVRDRLPFRARGRLHQLNHRVDVHSLRRVEHELSALQIVAAHLEQTPKRCRLKGADKLRNPSLQSRGRRDGRFVVAHLVGDLEQIAHDHLVVRCLAIMFVDGVRHLFGLERRILAPAISCDRRSREANPELRGAAVLRVGWSTTLGGLLVVVEQLETVVGERKQLHVRPHRVEQLGLHAQRKLVSLRLDSHRAECIAQLFALKPAHELDRSDVMPVQFARQFAQQGMKRAGGHALDDQLAARHPDRKRGPVHEQGVQFSVHSIDRLAQQGMAGRIDRVLVHCDRELHEELRQLSRELWGADRTVRGGG